MTPTRTRLFLWIACVATFGTLPVTFSRLPHDFEPGPKHPAWLDRYEGLEAGLEGESVALFVSDDDGGTAKYKLFRAQFALAPVIILDRRDVATLKVGQLLVKPLILDASSPRALEEAVAHLAASALESRLTLEVQRLPGRLAIVRARSPR